MDQQEFLQSTHNKYQDRQQSADYKHIAKQLPVVLFGVVIIYTLLFLTLT